MEGEANRSHVNKGKIHRLKEKGATRRNLIMREEIEKLQKNKYELPGLNVEDVKSFASLPISAKTLKGLKDAKFTVPTKVQRESLKFSLGGCDVVAAAKTGSGKTLAFIIPILEKLYCTMWNHVDGLGALVITPTRELAYQIFDVLNKIGKEHDFSAGLIIGGTDISFEWQRINTCNIIISTPGRLLQHMTENPNFPCDNVQILILDEADMCLSMGFSETMNCLLEELPTERQTLLFSATQTRDVKNLVRAGCKNPVFCSVHEHSKTTTPKGLDESYVVCEAHEKFTFLWSFIKYHKKQKIMVFLSTCKQVKYIYNMVCKLQPGLTVMALHGKMNQLKRMAIYEQFSRKQFGVLFTTDVASRGLDFPAVHWVVQADCPEDVTTYIHRAGRTARYSLAGNSLLVLTPSEEPRMVINLKAKNIPIQKIFVDANKQYGICTKMDIVLTKYIDLKEDAVLAFKAYIKHIAKMKDKKIFNVLALDLDAYARSLGLIVTPRIRFLERLLKLRFGSKDGGKQQITSGKDSGEKSHPRTLDFGAIDSDDADDDGFLVSSKTQHVTTDEDLSRVLIKPLSNKQKKKKVTREDIAKKLLRKNVRVNKIIKLDDDGNAILDPTKVQISDAAQGKEWPSKGININELKTILKEEDAIDKKIHKAKEKSKKREKKQKERKRKEKDNERPGENDKDDENDDDDADSDHDAVTQEIIDSLPDPDNVYGEQGPESNSEDEASEGDNDDGEASNYASIEKVPKISGKRKARTKLKDAKRAKMGQMNTLSDLPMDEQEQLALFLLSGKK